MEAQISRIMEELGVRYDQAYRMVRTRTEFNRRKQFQSSNWLK